MTRDRLEIDRTHVANELPFEMGGYRLVEKLGAGGMGVVYRALDLALDRTVAIKMMHAKAGDAPNPDHSMVFDADVDIAEVHARFQREARAAARIKSRHVAQVLQLGETDDGAVYIVMEFLKGTPLSKLMHKLGPMRPERVVHIATQICRGMQAAHDLGVVHRDLKPANIMLVNEDGDGDFVKILDFGVAKLTDEGSAQLTQTGALLGTLSFMPPEQLLGQAIDHRTDIYALGVVLYRMFTGVTVWEGESAADLLRLLNSQKAPSMFRRLSHPSFTPKLDAIVLKCLEREPRARWQSMRDLEAALDGAAPNKSGARVVVDDDDTADLGSAAAPVSGPPATVVSRPAPSPIRPALAVAKAPSATSLSPSPSPSGAQVGDVDLDPTLPMESPKLPPLPARPPRAPPKPAPAPAPAPAPKTLSSSSSSAPPSPKPSSTRGSLVVVGVIAFIITLVLVALVSRGLGMLPSSSSKLTNDAPTSTMTGPAKTDGL